MHARSTRALQQSPAVCGGAFLRFIQAARAFREQAPTAADVCEGRRRFRGSPKRRRKEGSEGGAKDCGRVMLKRRGESARRRRSLGESLLFGAPMFTERNERSWTDEEKEKDRSLLGCQVKAERTTERRKMKVSGS